MLLMFGSFGTPSNLATRTYLNEKKIPQLFVASGDEEWAHPKTFPWTMGWQPTFRAEGRIYANYIQASYAEQQDRRALAERPVRPRSVPGIAGRPRRHRQQ